MECGNRNQHATLSTYNGALSSHITEVWVGCRVTTNDMTCAWDLSMAQLGGVARPTSHARAHTLSLGNKNVIG